MEKRFYVYIMANKRNGTLYVGITSNLLKRVWEHKNKLVKGFTKKYNVESLVFYEQFLDVEHAIKREKRLKKYSRQWKINLIEGLNPGWKDLYEDIRK